MDHRYRIETVEFLAKDVHTTHELHLNNFDHLYVAGYWDVLKIANMECRPDDECVENLYFTNIIFKYNKQINWLTIIIILIQL